jgi:hypothetical protein
MAIYLQAIFPGIGLGCIKEYKDNLIDGFIGLGQEWRKIGMAWPGLCF